MIWEHTKIINRLQPSKEMVTKVVLCQIILIPIDISKQKLLDNDPH